MSRLNNQKLILTSKIMLLILRILFVILLLMAIIPWVVPTSFVGSFLMSMFGAQQFTSTTKLYHLTGAELISVPFYNSNLLSRSLGFIGSMISLLPLLAGTMIMLKLSKRYAMGKIFTLNNAKAYSILGVIYLLSALLLQPLSQVFFSLCATINNPAGQRTIAFGIDINNLTAIFFAIVLIVIGQVMKFGQKINEEQELTV